MADENQNEKPHDPSAKKLDDARKKGQILRATDLNTVASYIGFLCVAYLFGSQILKQSGSSLQIFLAAPHELSDALLKESTIRDLNAAVIDSTSSFTLWFIFPALAVFLVLMAQRGLTFTGKNLEMKLSRISMISNAKSKFGLNGIFNFTKSTLKLLIISLLLMIFLHAKLDGIVTSLALEPNRVVAKMATLSTEFILFSTLIYLIIASADYIWQYFEHIRKNRMSDQDRKDEAKESEGDPHLKQERRQRAQQIAMSKMATEVPNATVVIVNPTHYAVALKWDRSQPGAPVCIAKGIDEIALKIREIAQEYSIPIRSDPPTARAVFSSTKVGEMIDEDLFRPVAAAIRFAEAVRNQSKRSILGRSDRK